MNRVKRRSKYQYGTLTQEKRSRGPDVWVYRFVELEEGQKRRRKTIVGTRDQYPTRAAAERASEHLRLSANPETFNLECPTMGGLIDRYIEQILRPCLDVPLGGVQESAAPMSFQCAKSYQSALNRWVRPRWQDYRLQEFNKPAVRASIEEWLRSLWRSPKNPSGLAPKMVRSIWNVMKLAFKFAVKWGYLNENPMGEKRVELPRGSTKRQKQPVQLSAAGFFLLLGHLGGLRETGSSLCGLARAAHQRGFRAEVAGPGPGCWRRNLSAGLRPGARHAAQDRGVTYQSADTGRRVGVAAPVALCHDSWCSWRLGLCLALYQGQAAILAGANDEETHQAGRLGAWSSKHRVAQLPAYGKCLGQGGGSRTGGGQDSSAARESCHYIRGLRRSWYGSQTADPAAAGELCQAAGHTHSIRACTHLVNLCDPYLTQIVFADSLEVCEKNGSSGRTRTYNPPVNSRMLCH